MKGDTMKKSISALMLFVVVALIGGCTDKPSIESNHSSDLSTTTVPVVEHYGAENEEGITFSEAFYGNPIDQAYDTAIETNESFGQLTSIGFTFQKYWEAEIDAVVVRLFEVLDEEEASSLKKAQRAWKEYMESNEDFRYGALWRRNWQGDRHVANTLLLNEARERAIELMEIYFILTGEIEFVYEG